jgi:hypothetical protein
VDLYNALNTGAVLTLNNTYGVPWLTPQSILTARYLRFGVQFDF